MAPSRGVFDSGLDFFRPPECTDCFFSNTGSFIDQSYLDVFGIPWFPSVDAIVCDKDKERILDRFEDFFALAATDPFYGTPFSQIGGSLMTPLLPGIPGFGFDVDLDPSGGSTAASTPYAGAAEAFLNYIRFGRKKWSLDVILYMDQQPQLKDFLTKAGYPVSDPSSLECQAKEGILDFAQDALAIVGYHPLFAVPMGFLSALLNFSRKKWDKALLDFFLLGLAGKGALAFEGGKITAPVYNKTEGVLRFACDVADLLKDSLIKMKDEAIEAIPDFKLELLGVKITDENRREQKEMFMYGQIQQALGSNALLTGTNGCPRNT
jgi:hypothetical protein